MIRILIADDHTILRDGLKQILSVCSDMKVAGEADNGLDTLHKIRTEEWDVILLDMSMPGKSGIELIKQIKREKPKLPVIILSMHKEDQYAVRTIKAGASGYLCKDSASAQLVNVIRKVAGGGIFISQEMAEKLAHGLHAPSEEPAHTLLSDREYQVFMKLVQGMSLTEIADEFNLSVKTVSTHKTHVQEKMRADNLSMLIKYAIKHDLLDEAGDLHD